MEVGLGSEFGGDGHGSRELTGRHLDGVAVAVLEVVMRAVDIRGNVLGGCFGD